MELELSSKESKSSSNASRSSEELQIIGSKGIDER